MTQTNKLPTETQEEIDFSLTKTAALQNETLDDLSFSLTKTTKLPQIPTKAAKLVMAMQMHVRDRLKSKIEELKIEHNKEIGKLYAKLASQQMQSEAEKGALLEDQQNQEIQS